MDYSFIIRQLQVLINDNRISFIPLTLLLINLIIFIVSRTFRKTGLFVLALAFLIDYTIKSMPFDLYLTYPELYNAVTVLYIIGFILFFLKVLKMIIRINNTPIAKEARPDSKFRQFMKFTGLMPFLLMLIVNIIDVNQMLPKNIVGILTSLSFLFMMIKTIYSTYKFLRTKESIILADRMDFDEIKNFLNEDTNKSKSNSKNQGRRIRKSFDEPVYNEPTELINKADIEKTETQHVAVKKTTPKSNAQVPRIVKDDPIKVSQQNSDLPHKLSNTELLKIVAADDVINSNITTMSITNLITTEKISFTSTRPQLNIHENEEYKIDLEFETVNEYDYGRFIDILLVYSKNKDKYKFELVIAPEVRPNSKIIFYDPSNIYDIDEKDYANASGKTISMNFPKYKINFITGN